MGDIGNVTDSKACFPVRTVNKGSTIAWIFGVFTWPSLHGHVMDVNPAAASCFPSDFILTDLDDGVTNTGGWDAWKCPGSATLEVEVSDGYATTSFSQSGVALLVIRVGYENVPFSINHVWVEIVWTTWVIDIVP